MSRLKEMVRDAFASRPIQFMVSVTALLLALGWVFYCLFRYAGAAIGAGLILIGLAVMTWAEKHQIQQRVDETAEYVWLFCRAIAPGVFGGNLPYYYGTPYANTDYAFVLPKRYLQIYHLSPDMVQRRILEKLSALWEIPVQTLFAVEPSVIRLVPYTEGDNSYHVVLLHKPTPSELTHAAERLSGNPGHGPGAPPGAEGAGRGPLHYDIKSVGRWLDTQSGGQDHA